MKGELGEVPKVEAALRNAFLAVRYPDVQEHWRDMALAAIIAISESDTQTIARTPDGILWAYSGSEWRKLGASGGKG